ncbi:TFIIIC transcription initiation factor complex subunits Tfc3 [Emericellopsis cladophorae]|uniref:TFIIIC transcription initiation factor complex subunits Tfc3 n=1 Tax=Emericellopsis cladophorae TaxID=2686198 RepID=A0A9Q0BDC8_9HYPO|nr:TFIIIC transcription initiation factor complex subunits Tfc3 [Emericellopsis cladophorae]KAI6781252.1 TFIIIC transcription initiation factor complex subunits Tfc3 [Emericellopsis cladophorae]
MTLDLEGLIGGLILLISCSGEKGCPVGKVIETIEAKLAAPSDIAKNHDSAFRKEADNHSVTTIWSWLVARPDISVGPDRSYNHLALPEVQALCLQTPVSHRFEAPATKSEKDSPQTAKGLLSQNTSSHVIADTSAAAFEAVYRDSHSHFPSPTQQVDASSRDQHANDVRVFASEDRMWECIAGHAVDHKRLPRLEWTCLMGIASTMTDGILQGDLGRLVDQDKRSVPKRTDVLDQKGYITKRSALLRGTKTSRLWLHRFAPGNIEKAISEEVERAEVGLDLSQELLAEDLEPVPWSDRWNKNDNPDYISLIRTIMAITKSWGVIRGLDLRRKLDVIGKPWHMKMVSQCCRFLHGRGCLLYVAAQHDVGEQVYKDCIQFVRDVESSDYKVYLATGSRRPEPSGVVNTAENDEAEGPQLRSTLQNSFPPWSVDEPFGNFWVRMAQACLGPGVANPDIGTFSMGPGFNRYISSTTHLTAGAMAQPPYLQHFQVTEELVRTGKIASFRYVVPERVAIVTSQADETFGFTPFAPKKHEVDQVASLSRLCRSTIVRGKNRGKPKLERMLATGTMARGDDEDRDCIEVKRPSPVKKAHQKDFRQSSIAISEVGSQADKASTLIVTLKVRPQVLERIALATASRSTVCSQAEDDAGPVSLLPGKATSIRQQELSPHSASETLEPPAGSQSGIATSVPNNLGAVDQELAATISPLGHPASEEAPRVTGGRGRGRGRGARGRGRGGGGRTTGSSDIKPWKCEKCGGAWKNDIGLKYHLEKARVPCNVNWDPAAEAARLIERKMETQKTKAAKDQRQLATASTQPEEAHSDAAATSDTLDGIAKRRKRVPRYVSSPRSRSPSAASVRDDSSRKVPITKRFQVVKLERTVPDDAARNPMLPTQGLLLPTDRLRLRTVADLALGPGLSTMDVTETGRERSGSTCDNFPGQPSTVGYPSEEDTLAGQEVQKRYFSGHHSKLNRLEGRLLNQKERNERTSHLLKILLRDHDGVFPGGEALWRALRVLWDREYRHEVPRVQCLTNRSFWGSVIAMIRNKEVAEHWHVFRRDDGKIAKVQTLTSTGEDPSSPKVVRLVELMKNRYPDPYVPDSIRNAEVTVLKINGHAIPSRRPLPTLVSRLEAPVYTKQLAAKRLKEHEQADAKKTNRPRWSVGAQRKGPAGKLGWVGHSNSKPWPTEDPEAGPSSVVTFLDPNTYLEDDTPDHRPKESRLVDANATKRIESHRKRLLASDTCITNPIVPSLILEGNGEGAWEFLGLKFFETSHASFTLDGWMPSSTWFKWEELACSIDMRTGAKAPKGFHRYEERDRKWSRAMDRIHAIYEAEQSDYHRAIKAAPGEAGPHNIFVDVIGDSGPFDSDIDPSRLEYVEQLTLADGRKIQDDAPDSDSWDSNDDAIVFIKGLASPFVSAEETRRKKGALRAVRGDRGKGVPHQVPSPRPERAKFVPLKMRQLTALPSRVKSQAVEGGETVQYDEPIPNPKEVLAAFVAVRALLGGVDRFIDWGILVDLFPDIELARLRRFWLATQKARGPFVAEFMHDFQDRYIAACGRDELPLIDYEHAADYDWQGLVRWTMEIPAEKDQHLPPTMENLDDSFVLKDVERDNDDWKEKYYHVATSTLARLEFLSSEPAAISGHSRSRCVDRYQPARSWMRSLCITPASGTQAAAAMRKKLLELGGGNQSEVSHLLNTAIDQLSETKVLKKTKKSTIPGGVEYRLSEPYTTSLARLSQMQKYKEAQQFKESLDAAARKGESFPISYTLSDGAMMAVMNLSANGRVRVRSTDVPYIPFGFIPGNYESRKMPKTNLHFGIAVEATDDYLYNQDISLLHHVRSEEPPRVGPAKAIPQWIDFWNRPQLHRWWEVLASVLFLFSTRGEMSGDLLVKAMKPVLEPFEAEVILDWCVEKGLLENEEGELRLAEWWWLAVPMSQR